MFPARHKVFSNQKSKFQYFIIILNPAVGCRKTACLVASLTAADYSNASMERSTSVLLLTVCKNCYHFNEVADTYVTCSSPESGWHAARTRE